MLIMVIWCQKLHAVDRTLQYHTHAPCIIVMLKAQHCGINNSNKRDVVDCFQGRISQDYEHFLIAPFGMLHHEVTASSLVKVDMRGDVLDVGASGTGLGVNKLGFSLHGAVYASRPDIKCIIHLRCPSAVAVSVQSLIAGNLL